MRAFNAGLLTSALVFAVAAADAPFTHPDPASLKSHTSQGVTVAAKAYDTPALVKQAFGKLDPVKYGVLPVYLYVENKSGKAISLTKLRAEYVEPDRSRVEAIPASEVKYFGGGPTKPNINPSPLPIPRKVRVKKGPLSDQIIEERAFTARALPPGDFARGFLYFDTAHRPGSTLYVTGLADSASGQELFYFEVVLPE